MWGDIYIYIWYNTGRWFGTWIWFFHILGMSSSQLTNSIIFQRGRYITNQTMWNAGNEMENSAMATHDITWYHMISHDLTWSHMIDAGSSFWRCIKHCLTVRRVLSGTSELATQLHSGLCQMTVSLEMAMKRERERESKPWDCVSSTHPFPILSKDCWEWQVWVGKSGSRNNGCSCCRDNVVLWMIQHHDSAVIQGSTGG